MGVSALFPPKSSSYTGVDEPGYDGMADHIPRIVLQFLLHSRSSTFPMPYGFWMPSSELFTTRTTIDDTLFRHLGGISLVYVHGYREVSIYANSRDTLPLLLPLGKLTRRKNSSILRRFLSFVSFAPRRFSLFAVLYLSYALPAIASVVMAHACGVSIALVWCIIERRERTKVNCDKATR